MTPEQRAALDAIVAADAERKAARAAVDTGSPAARGNLAKAHSRASRALNARIVDGNAAGLTYKVMADALGVSAAMVGQRADQHRKASQGLQGWLPPWSRRRKAQEPVA